MLVRNIEKSRLASNATDNMLFMNMLPVEFNSGVEQDIWQNNKPSSYRPHDSYNTKHVSLIPSQGKIQRKCQAQSLNLHIVK